MRTIEHITAVHKIAHGRRAAGLPVWDRTIRLGDIFRNCEMSFEDRRDVIVTRIRESGWLTERDDSLTEAVDDLAQSTDEDDFDQFWDLIYDHADFDRVWIDTISKPREGNDGKA